MSVPRIFGQFFIIDEYLRLVKQFKDYIAAKLGPNDQMLLKEGQNEYI